MTDVLLPFGLRDGELVHVSSVESGLTDCVCPECGETLIANKGDQRRHHFHHKGNAGNPLNHRCSGGFETLAHLRAKAIIEEAMRVRFPHAMVGGVSV